MLRLSWAVTITSPFKPFNTENSFLARSPNSRLWTTSCGVSRSLALFAPTYQCTPLRTTVPCPKLVLITAAGLSPGSSYLATISKFKFVNIQKSTPSIIINPKRIISTHTQVRCRSLLLTVVFISCAGEELKISFLIHLQVSFLFKHYSTRCKVCPRTNPKVTATLSNKLLDHLNTFSCQTLLVGNASSSSHDEDTTFLLT